jgi:hypothetical protein
MTDTGSNSTSDAARRVSQTLKIAFEVVASSALAVDDKGRWQQRLIAITNTTKHDVTRAHEQLKNFSDEWNALGAGKEIVH